MTTVIAVETKDGVVFGADSRATWGNYVAHAEQKIFRVGPVVIGSAGDVRVGNVIRHTSLPDYSGRTVVDAERFLVQEVIPAWQKALEDAKSLEVQDGKSNNDSHLIVAVGNHAFYMAANFALVRTADKLYAVGSGGQFALGALAAGATPEQSLKVAAKLDAYTGGKLSVVEAKGVK